MPPHCDALDGPVVTAARAAMDASDVDLVLPYVHEDGEAEVRAAFERAVKVAALGAEAKEVGELWFFETVVRIHRAGEGAPFTGLKPAGLDVGPAIPAAEQALRTGSPEPLADVLCGEVRDQVARRLDHAMSLKDVAARGLRESRDYVEAMLDLQVWSHAVHRQVTAGAHGHAGAHDHG